MRSVTTFAMSSLVLTLMIAARSYRPAIEYTSLTPSMSAIASATLLILSLSTVRRTIADTIGYLLNFQWSHVESISRPLSTESIRDPFQRQLSERRSYRFALRPIEWFYLAIGDRNFGRLANTKKRHKIRRQAFERGRLASKSAIFRTCEPN